jgi:hypothetical protein
MLSGDSLEKTEIAGFVIDNNILVDKIKEYYVKYNPTVVIEDIRPYNSMMSMQVIRTCQFIGELKYRLQNELQLKIHMVTRGDVKKWVFTRFPGLCKERIDQKIQYLDDYGERKGKKRYRNKDGELRKATFHWVDDRVVIAAMKEYWKIPTPKPGKKNLYGFSSHSWNALAAGSCFLNVSFYEIEE